MKNDHIDLTVLAVRREKEKAFSAVVFFVCALALTAAAVFCLISSCV